MGNSRLNSMLYCVKIINWGDTRMDYLKRMRDLREDHDLSQKTVAKYLGISQSMYSAYEIGRSMIPPLLLLRLAEYYDVNLYYLFSSSDEPGHFHA